MGPLKRTPKEILSPFPVLLAFAVQGIFPLACLPRWWRLGFLRHGVTQPRPALGSDLLSGKKHRECVPRRGLAGGVGGVFSLLLFFFLLPFFFSLWSPLAYPRVPRFLALETPLRRLGPGVDILERVCRSGGALGRGEDSAVRIFLFCRGAGHREVGAPP
ncbi:hypothetical protein EV126DRAFT_191685 [Verticillium dahliae]|nr:hypothetical protein EV126DRAFT_191685 [Verticillium dahliae]